METRSGFLACIRGHGRLIPKFRRSSLELVDLFDLARMAHIKKKWQGQPICWPDHAWKKRRRRANWLWVLDDRPGRFVECGTDCESCLECFWAETGEPVHLVELSQEDLAVRLFG